MDLSLSSISAGAMTAAVSIGSSVQGFGAAASTALHTLPTVAAGGLQAVAQGAGTAAATLPTSGESAAAVKNFGLVNAPAAAIAAGVPRATLLVRTAAFLSKALPIVTIGASSLTGARVVSDEGARALVTTKIGRGAVLGAVGGTLLLVPHPATQLAAAGVLGAVAANHFGGLDGLDTSRPRAR